MKKIGLVVAMPEETEHVLEKLGKEKGRASLLNYEIIKYAVEGKKIYLINSGVGEINAAVCAALLINEYGVEAIINYGLAGALKDDIALDEFLLASEIVHYDFDISAFTGRLRGAYPGMDSPAMTCNNDLLALADIANGVPLKRVKVASADKFVAASKSKRLLVEEFNADICEMESAGIYRTCLNAGIPALFIKSVSDSADEGAADSIADTVSRGVTSYVTLISNLIKLL